MNFYRKWVAEKLSDLLGIDDEASIDDVLDRYSEEVRRFFEAEISGDDFKQLLFVWRTFEQRTIEESITVFEEGNGIAAARVSSCLMCSIPPNSACGANTTCTTTHAEAFT